VDDAPGAGVGAHPVDVLADVEGKEQNAIGIEAGDVGRELTPPPFTEVQLPFLLPIAKAIPFLLALGHD